MRRIMHREHVGVTMYHCHDGAFADIAEIRTVGPDQRPGTDGTGEISIAFGLDDMSYERSVWDTDQELRLTHAQATALRDALTRCLAASDG